MTANTSVINEENDRLATAVVAVTMESGTEVQDSSLATSAPAQHAGSNTPTKEKNRGSKHHTSSPYNRRRQRQYHIRGSSDVGSSASLRGAGGFSGSKGTRSSSDLGALDQAPPIQFLPSRRATASSSTKIITQRHQTPQFIATLHVQVGMNSGTNKNNNEESQSRDNYIDEEDRRLLDFSAQSMAPVQVISCATTKKITNTKNNDIYMQSKYLLQPLGKGCLALWNLQSMLYSYQKCQKNNHEILSNVLTVPEILVDLRLPEGSGEWVELIPVPQSVVAMLQLTNSTNRAAVIESSLVFLGLCTTGTVVLFSVNIPSSKDIGFPRNSRSVQTPSERVPVPPPPQIPSVPPPQPQEQQHHHQVLLTWTMGNGGVTCLEVTKSGLVLVGDHVGRVFATRLTMVPSSPPPVPLPSAVTKQRNPSPQSPLLARTVTPKRNISAAANNNENNKNAVAAGAVQAVPAWHGFFGHGHAIRSMLELATEQSNTTKQDKRSDSIVAMTVQPKNRIATAMQLEVINVDAISKDYAATVRPPTNSNVSGKPGASRQHAQKDNENNNNQMAMVTLENYWVLPEPGWELADAPLLKDDGVSSTEATIRMIHWIPSQGSHRLHRLEQNGAALALADGTGAILTLQKQQQQQQHPDAPDEFSWGIRNHAQDQWLFSYPCIGMGHVRDKGQLHIACALRGGTVYLIPIDPNKEVDADTEHTVKVVTYPHDADFDCPTHHLQSFAAADVPFSLHADSDHDASVDGLPLLFFTWPRGIIDVYACHLLLSPVQKNHKDDESSGKVENEQQLLLAKLVDNGVAEDLRTFLKSSKLDEAVPTKKTAQSEESVISDQHQLLLQLWIHAAKDAANLDRPITLNDVNSENGSRHFRSLLLHLASSDYEMEQVLVAFGTSGQ